MKIEMKIMWFDRKQDDFKPDYNNVHFALVTGNNPQECMREFRKLSDNHDLVRYTRMEILEIY